MNDIPRKRRFPRKPIVIYDNFNRADGWSWSDDTAVHITSNPIVRRTPSAFSVGGKQIVWTTPSLWRGGSGGGGVGTASSVSADGNYTFEGKPISMEWPEGDRIYT